MCGGAGVIACSDRYPCLEFTARLHFYSNNYDYVDGEGWTTDRVESD